MIGNDIIDLAEAHRINWNRKNYLKKLFSADEFKLILNSKNPELMVWLLWSMKESSYKIYMRGSLERSYDPIKFNCLISKVNINSCQGEVYYKDKKYFTYSSISSEFISTIAISKNNSSRIIILQSHIKCSGNKYMAQHSELYESALKKFSEKTGKSFKDLSIKKDLKGIPHLQYKNNLLQMSISLSHHGNYASYAIACENYTDITSNGVLNF